MKSNVRQWLMVTFVVMLAVAMAACAAPAAPGEAPAAEAPAEEAAAPAEGEAGEGALEIFSWWTTGGEVEALNAVYDIFSETIPGRRDRERGPGRWCWTGRQP